MDDDECLRISSRAVGDFFWDEDDDDDWLEEEEDGVNAGLSGGSDGLTAKSKSSGSTFCTVERD